MARLADAARRRRAVLLLITQSLLNDSDLKIENNYRERQYESYFREGPLRPDFVKYGANGEIYSIHAPGLPALVAPAFAIAGYPGVKLFLLLVSALNAALVWWLGYRVSGSAAAAWFGWAAVSLSTTNVFHASTVFPDGPGGLLVLTGVWALVRLDTRAETAPTTRSLAWHGAALALLPWLHSRFALLAGVLGALIVLRVLQRLDRPSAVRRVAAFAMVPALSAAAWFGFFYTIYGTADPRAPYGGAIEGRWENVTSGLGGLFFDQQFGLLPYAPVLLPALKAAGAGAGFGVQLDPPRRIDPGSVPARLALEPIPRYLESRDRPLFNMPELPSGRYALRIETRPQPSGSVSIGIAPEGGLLREVSLSQADARQVFTVEVGVPVNVRAIAMWGDDPARAAITRITLLPQSIAEPSRRATDARARRVSRYLSGLVYFFDDEVFPEPEAFWVCGRSETVFALEVSDRASLLLRNGPVPNRVKVESGSWSEAIDLSPGEERTLDVPRAPERDATLVRLASSSGFRPSEVNRASQDTRFLGVWVQPR